ncbi:hypothetical protein PInf_010794 [Phytophthora infestans]|nr:hypothetical protein PInf_010794 [Phytophthora infestans]
MAQARSAQKRPLGAADESDSSEGNESSGYLSEWQPSPGLNGPEMLGTSSSASDEAGQQLVIAPSPEQTQFESWEAFEDYLRVYQAQSFQLMTHLVELQLRQTTHTPGPRVNCSSATPNVELDSEWDDFSQSGQVTESGNQSAESGNQSGESGNRSGESGNQSGNQTGESGSQSGSHTGEKMVVVEVIGVGTFSTKKLGVMKMWHNAKKMTILVEKAVSWIETVDFPLHMPSCFKVNQDPNLIEKLKSIPLLSTQV